MKHKDKNVHIYQWIKRRIPLIICLVLIWSSPVLAERLSVTVPDANVRSGPGTHHEVLWHVEKFHPLDILKKTGAWCFFQDFEGDTGWIHQSLVKKIPSIIVKSNIANVRSGPGTTHKILSAVEKGVPFKVLKRQGNWIHVEHGDGDRGWIHNSLVW